MRTNYHTHTRRCNHAEGSDECYVLSAIEGGYDLLGFSDHTPWPFKDGYRSNIRMAMDELDGYVATVRYMADRYKDDIEILVGMECEYYIDHTQWLQEQKDRLELDYLIFGNHFPYYEKGAIYLGDIQSHKDLKLYLDSSLKALESGLFDYFAHPELYMRNYPKVDDYCKSIFRELAAASRDLDIAFERNATMKFIPELWEIVSQEAPRVIVGLDVHKSTILRYHDQYDATVNELKSVGITPITRLK